MDVTPALPEGRNIVDSYGPGRFRIRGTLFSGSVLITADDVIEWDVKSFSTLTMESLSPLLKIDPKPEIILLGTGARMEMPPPGLRTEMRHVGLKVDFMDSGAACRTFNILMVEGRRAMAALIAI